MDGIRLVCVGDSFTEGMCDDLRPDGHHLGWADRVAAGLAAHVSPAPVEYANLAVRGKLLDQVVADQLGVAVSFAPTVLTFHAGPNDVLRRSTDLDDLGRRYDAAVARAVDVAGRVVLFTSIGRAGGDTRIGRLVAQRFARFNDMVRSVAGRRGADVVDLGAVDVLADRRLWAVDRLHLAPDGHARVAAAVLEHLGVTRPDLVGDPGWWREPLAAQLVRTRRQALVEDAAWVRGHLLPWLGRRLRGVSSGDGRTAKDDRPRLLTGS